MSHLYCSVISCLVFLSETIAAAHACIFFRSGSEHLVASLERVTSSRGDCPPKRITAAPCATVSVLRQSGPADGQNRAIQVLMFLKRFTQLTHQLSGFLRALLVDQLAGNVAPWTFSGNGHGAGVYRGLEGDDQRQSSPFQRRVRENNGVT